jgi:hypothetical protein
VRGELFKFRPLDKDDALPLVRKACAGEMRWRPGGPPGPESVHDTTLATLDEQSRRQVGPKILLDRPAQGLPLSLHQNFPVGWPLVETRAEPKCDGCGGVADFFNRRGRAGADGEGAAVEQRCDGSPASGVGIGTPYNGNSVAFPAVGAGGNRYAYNARDAG